MKTGKIIPLEKKSWIAHTIHLEECECKLDSGENFYLLYNKWKEKFFLFDSNGKLLIYTNPAYSGLKKYINNPAFLFFNVKEDKPIAEINRKYVNYNIIVDSEKKSLKRKKGKSGIAWESSLFKFEIPYYQHTYDIEINEEKKEISLIILYSLLYLEETQIDSSLG